MVDQPSYEQALRFLYDRIDYERSAARPTRLRTVHLERMKQLLNKIGEPQREFPAVHIAGTKGKGSTAAMVDSILRAAGYSIGLYTSPHLERLEERFVVNGVECTPGELVRLVEGVRPAIEDLDHASSKSGGPTFFEITTAMAMRFFAEKQVDLAVLEVGMGGRLDSTNVCEPLVSVITSISLDHTKQLGSTLSAIATEKAGILKPTIPVVSGVGDPEPRGVIRSIAEARRCPLKELFHDFDFIYRSLPPDSGRSPTRLDYREPGNSPHVIFEAVDVALHGRHQAANAAIAIATCRQLNQQGLKIDEEAIRGGLRRLTVAGRVEVVGASPTIVVDTAHNVASIVALVDTLQAFPARKRWLIFATSLDKDAQGMLAQLVGQFDELLVTRYRNNPRGADPQQLAELARKLPASNRATPLSVEVCESPHAAWDRCLKQAHAADLICVAGSFFLAAELRSEIRNHTRQPQPAT